MSYGIANTTGSTELYEQISGDQTTEYHYYYYDVNADYEYSDHLYEIFDFEVPIYEYIWPIIVFIAASCNVLVITGFLRKRMRNATNILLVSIAVSDSLTGLVTLPGTIHVFSLHNFALSKEWCEATMLLRLFISRAFHTASVWQTLLLAIHRYAVLRNPVKAQQWITIKTTAIFIAAIYLLSFVLHIYHVFDLKAEYGFCQWSVEHPCVGTCIYIWFTLLFGHLLPCLVLLFLTFGMVRRLRMLDKNRPNEVTLQSRKRIEQVRMLTKMVVAIVVIFLVPEFPYGIFYLITASLGHSENNIFPLNVNRLIHCIYEVLLVVSFHLNFWVYLLLIRRFRSSIKRLIKLVTCKVVSFKRLEDDTTSSEAVELQAMRSDTEHIG